MHINEKYYKHRVIKNGIQNTMCNTHMKIDMYVEEHSQVQRNDKIKISKDEKLI